MVIRPRRESAEGWTRRPVRREPQLFPLNEPGWALNVFWLPADREEGVRRALTQVSARQAGSTPGPGVPRWNQMGD